MQLTYNQYCTWWQACWMQVYSAHQPFHAQAQGCGVHVGWRSTVAHLEMSYGGLCVVPLGCVHMYGTPRTGVIYHAPTIVARAAYGRDKSRPCNGRQFFMNTDVLNGMQRFVEDDVQ